jgi:hypothetical protein
LIYPNTVGVVWKNRWDTCRNESHALSAALQEWGKLFLFPNVVQYQEGSLALIKQSTEVRTGKLWVIKGGRITRNVLSYFSYLRCNCCGAAHTASYSHEVDTPLEVLSYSRACTDDRRQGCFAESPRALQACCDAYWPR